MKAAKTILYLIVVLVILLYAGGYLIKSEYQVERKVEIRADYATVFPMISNLKEMRHWSPWHDRDPQLEEIYEGEDGMPGSIHRWKGNDETGQGEQEILSVRPDRIEIEVRFRRPFKAKNFTWITIDTKGTESIEVVWGLKGKIPRPLNLMLLFTDIEKSIGDDYEHGLKKLKELAELRFAEQNPFKEIQVQDVSFQMRFFTYKSIETTYKNLIHDAINVAKELESITDKKDIKPFGNLVVITQLKKDSVLSAHVGFPFENTVKLTGFKSGVLPEGDYHFIPVNLQEYSMEVLPQIVENKLQINAENQRILIDFLDFPSLRKESKRLIGVFIPK